MKIITESAALNAFCDRLARESFITVDTEFHREKTYYSKLCLVQLGGEEDVAAVDPLADGMDLAPLGALLANPDVLKVFHSASQDLEIFYQLFNAIPHPVFDTQVAAMVCGYGESVSYEKLVRSLVGEELDKTQRFTDWTRRPLSEKQLKYALGDVTHLRVIYRRLSGELKKRNREHWVSEEMATLLDTARYTPHPEEVWRRLRLRSHKPCFLALAKELARWREETAMDENVPRNRVFKDDALLEIAAAAPQSHEELKRLRGVHGGIAKRYGKGILEAVNHGLALPKEAVPKLPRPPKPLTESQAALADLLKLLVKLRCREEDVAPRLVASPKDIEALVRGEEVHAMHGWRYEIFGKYAEQLKSGKLLLGYRDGELVFVPA